jgi:hypothetical protein
VHLLQQPVLLALRADKQLQLIQKALQAGQHQALPRSLSSGIPDHLTRLAWRPELVAATLSEATLGGFGRLEISQHLYQLEAAHTLVQPPTLPVEQEKGAWA